MNKLKSRIHDEANGLDYILVGDYYIPAIELPGTMTVPSESGGRCTGHIWKKRTCFCSIT